AGNAEAGAAAGEVAERALMDGDRPPLPAQEQRAKQPRHRAADYQRAARGHGTDQPRVKSTGGSYFERGDPTASVVASGVGNGWGRKPVVGQRDKSESASQFAATRRLGMRLGLGFKFALTVFVILVATMAANTLYFLRTSA